MSFFSKLIEEKNEDLSLAESIENQIKIFLSNQSDVYWTYDSNTKKLEGIHKIFEKEYLSDEFLFELQKILPIFENRIKNVVCSLVYEDKMPYLAIEATIKKTNQKLSTINFNIQNI